MIRSKTQQTVDSDDRALDDGGPLPIWRLKIGTGHAESNILEGASGAVLVLCGETAGIEWQENIAPDIFERCRQRLEGPNFKVQTRPHPRREGIFFAAKPHVRSLSRRRGLTGADL